MICNYFDRTATALVLCPVARVVYAKQVLAYLGRYTHRVAIANSRLLACENGQVRFRWKDYRR